MRKFRENKMPCRNAARLSGAAGAMTLAFAVQAQDFVLDTYYDCARATNTKSYCKQVGKGSNYFPVSDEFLARFMTLKSGQQNNASSTGAGAAVPVVNVVNATNTLSIQVLTNDASEIRGLIDLYTRMIAEQKQISTNENEDASTAGQAIEILNNRIAEL